MPTRGAPPIGVTTTRDGERVECPREMKLLRRLHYLITLGLSHRRATERLNKEGFRTRRAGELHHPYILEYMRSAAYRKIEAEGIDVTATA